MTEPRQLSERFWAKVDRGGSPFGCWTWTAGTASNGYGSIRIDGRGALAHRVAYELLVGPIPDGLHLDHLCMSKLCVNPAHLEPVTLQENHRRWIATLTHCPRGHEYTEANTRVQVTGTTTKRQCRTCGNERQRERRQEARARG